MPATLMGFEILRGGLFPPFSKVRDTVPSSHMVTSMLIAKGNESYKNQPCVSENVLLHDNNKHFLMLNTFVVKMFCFYNDYQKNALQFNLLKNIEAFSYIATSNGVGVNLNSWG